MQLIADMKLHLCVNDVILEQGMFAAFVGTFVGATNVHAVLVQPHVT